MSERKDETKPTFPVQFNSMSDVGDWLAAMPVMARWGLLVNLMLKNLDEMGAAIHHAVGRDANEHPVWLYVGTTDKELISELEPIIAAAHDAGDQPAEAI